MTRDLVGLAGMVISLWKRLGKTEGVVQAIRFASMLTHYELAIIEKHEYK